MAIYNVKTDGNAPTNAKTGDYVVTGGGTYQILDSNKYSGMSADELANNGVAYNPNSGLYSKKVANVNSGEISLLGTDNLNSWKSSKDTNSISNLESAYATDKQNLQRTYNNSLTDYNQQISDVKQKYLDNITKLYSDTYTNNAKSLENASARGLTSSGLGNAMVVSGLVDAANQNAYYRATRDNDINKINQSINELTNNYNVDLDSLKSKLSSDKISALSENEIAYLSALMQIEETNNNTYNEVLNNKLQQAYEAEQALLDRQWQSEEKAKDRQASMDELIYQLTHSGSSGGYSYGGGGYSYGGNGYSSYGNSSSKSSGINYDDSATSLERLAATALQNGSISSGKVASNVATKLLNGSLSYGYDTNSLSSLGSVLKKNTSSSKTASKNTSKTTSKKSASKSGSASGLF